MKYLELDIGPDSSKRVRGQAGQVRQRSATLFARRLPRVAGCNRRWTVAGSDAGREQRAAAGVPWLGLLLWVFACAALFVSLIMRPNDFDGDRRVAASSAVVERMVNRAHAAPGLPGQASELSLFTAPRPTAR
jgi:hypothetical protein